jgi:hypothetical protein
MPTNVDIQQSNMGGVRNLGRSCGVNHSLVRLVVSKSVTIVQNVSVNATKHFKQEVTMSLLETAKACKIRQGSTPIIHEDIELAIAWLKGEINTTQVMKAYNMKSNTSAIFRTASALKLAYKNGLIESK